MRLVSFRRGVKEPVEAGALVADGLAPARAVLQVARESLGIPVPGPLKALEAVSMENLLASWAAVHRSMAAAMGKLERSPTLLADMTLPLKAVQLEPPLARPTSIRDFYSFEEHVKRARLRRGHPVPPEWYESPVFYFTNPSVVYGPDAEIPRPRATNEMDFELEVAWVIANDATDLDSQSAESVIAGLTIMNDWSARDVQRKEMAVGLGPSKGKDFATSMGPGLVTLDELQSKRRGDRYDLAMIARVNGQEVSRGNLADLHWTFGEMTAHASRDARISAGDVLATGTVGTGSLLDLGSTDWLKPGDVVELEVEELGVLRNKVVESRRR